MAKIQLNKQYRHCNDKLKFSYAVFIINFLNQMIIRVLLGIIIIYQWCISPFITSCCRFHPSCSSYAQQALKEHGVIFGLWITAKRLLKCHPFNPGGVDPVPSKRKKHG